MEFPLVVVVLVGLGCFVVGGIAVFLVRQMFAGRRVRVADEEAKRLIAEAQKKHKAALLEAKEAAINMKAEVEASYRETRAELQRLERRLGQKEENLERREESLQRRHEVLRRQGLLEGIWCLDPRETLSPGQSAEIDRVLLEHADLADDAFVRENLERWLS